MAVLSNAPHRPNRHSRHSNVHVSWLLADAHRHYRRRTNLHLGTSKTLFCKLVATALVCVAPAT